MILTYGTSHKMFTSLGLPYVSVNVLSGIQCIYLMHNLIARFMGPTWGLPGTDRTQVGPMWATWTLLSGYMLLYSSLAPWQSYDLWVPVTSQVSVKAMGKVSLYWPVAQIPQCTSPMSHNATFCNRNVHISVTKWCTVGCLSNALWGLRYGSIKPQQKQKCPKLVSLSGYIYIYKIYIYMYIYRIMYVLEWRTVFITRGLFFGVYFPSCTTTTKINTKITLEWAHE